MELSDLKGVGEARLEKMHQAGIYTMTELLLTLPSSYQDTTTSVPIAELVPGETVCVEGSIIKVSGVSRFHGKSTVNVRIQDDSGVLKISYFNQPWVAKQLHENEEIVLYGRVDRDKTGKICMYCPSRVTQRAILPVYRLAGAIPGTVVRQMIQQTLEQIDDCCPETLPDETRMRYHLCERNFALRQAHFPDNQENLALARRRLSFEGMLFYQTAALLMRGERTEGVQISSQVEQQAQYWASLPFEATEDQRTALSQIAQDMAGKSAMSRMVQGDVGCGKTAVAFGSIYLAARAGYQSALMAPTEILARQHLESAQHTLEKLNVKCGLLLGGMKAAQRREALENIASGAWQAVIGTHALISEGVTYQKLGLVVTDEQHRFGVRQRKALSQKAEETPNTLVMSATPIPRTLSLVLYGDLDLSVIRQLPPGRTPVKTRIVSEDKREGLYRFIIEEAGKGHQTYIVCPLVEENETLDAKSAQETYAELCNGPLSMLTCGLSWGGQEAGEKQRTLERFSGGEIQVLVATTVIEVGVNVPSATIMVIENADRFGLSQLHQLRGRVGRGAEESWCFLMAEPNERLKTLCATNDGFVIAQKDLDMRGPGDFLGTRQHGETLLPGMVMSSDSGLLEETHACLTELRQKGHEKEWEKVKSEAQKAFSAVMERIAMN